MCATQTEVIAQALHVLSIVARRAEFAGAEVTTIQAPRPSTRPSCGLGPSSG
jgi:hypothetical protein